MWMAMAFALEYDTTETSTCTKYLAQQHSRNGNWDLDLITNPRPCKAIDISARSSSKLLPIGCEQTSKVHVFY